MRVAIGSDHAGFDLKETIKSLLDELQIPYDDLGADSTASVDYPDFAEAVAAGRARRAGRPRHPRLRHRHRHGDRRQQDSRHPRRPRLERGQRARSSRAHNDANIMALGGRTTPPADVAGHRARVPRHRRSRAAATTPASPRSPISNARTPSHGRHRRRPPPQPAGDRPRDRAAPSATKSSDRPTGLELIASENFVSNAVLEAAGLGVHEQVRRRLSRAPVLRRLRVRRRRRAPGHRSRQGAVRRRSRQRAAALGRAGEHGRVLHAAQAGRHGARHEPVARRPPHARPPAELLGQALHDRALRRAPGRRAPRLRRDRAPGRPSTSRR